MSNPLAVATVTTTLRNLLFQGLNADMAGTAVTTRPPDRARVNATGNQVNLFLYQTAIEAAWRNTDMPGKVKRGELGNPPLPLVLNYLVTAYAEGDEDMTSHRLFGRAMSILHDHPTLGREELRAALAGNDLHEQVDRVHVTPHPMSIEELSKLWTTFQTPMRISTAYQACVVLIESQIQPRTPLPVLTRGQGDIGPVAKASSDDPFPRITSIDYANGQPSALTGGRIALRGRNLGGGPVAVEVSGSRAPVPVALATASATDTEIVADVPGDPRLLPAGEYALTVRIAPPGASELRTPTVPLSLAPRVTLGLPAVRAQAASIQLELRVEPDLLPDQSVALLVGARAVPGTFLAADRVRFTIVDLHTGDHVVRLRVDGVDTHLVDRSVTPPVFDPTQRLTIQ